MRPIHLLIKPASGSCNLRCRYCFYADEVSRRSIPNYGFMSLEALETIVRKTMQKASECAFMFQGGEPTLAGLEFYRHLVDLVERYNVRGIPVQFAIQTNGIRIDDDWAAFLAKHNFLTGLSLDGIAETHDRWRCDTAGGTYLHVLDAADRLTKAGAEFNILTVVTAQVAKRISAIYEDYRQKGFLYQQYIPCLDPLDQNGISQVYALTPALYTRFLKKLFDYWYADQKAGRFIYIRQFENYRLMMKGYPPENCGMGGGCSRQLVVEADGSVFPCDFYVLDEYRLGNILHNSFEELEDNRERLGILQRSRCLAEDCRQCEWLWLCRGGCMREREPIPPAGNGRLRFCESLKEFYRYMVPRMQELLAVC